MFLSNIHEKCFSKDIVSFMPYTLRQKKNESLRTSLDKQTVEKLKSSKTKKKEFQAALGSVNSGTAAISVERRRRR